MFLNIFSAILFNLLFVFDKEFQQEFITLSGH